MAVTYLRLFPATQQFEVRNGQLNVAGQLKVYFESTDDLADIYDENGTQLAQPVILDDIGRARGLFVDSKKVYRLEVYDRYGELLYTVRKMVPSGGGAGSALGNQYDILSTDGSITVDKYDDGGVTKFDIGLAPNDSDEFLEWIKCSEEDCGATWIPAYQSGTMETSAEGIKVHGGHLYHFTSTFYVDPDGTGINYDTFKVLMYCGDTVVDSRDFDIDSSVNDAVQCEFSTDVIPEEDSTVYFKLTIPSTCEVTGEVQAHRIYSGINAVPDTCATKQWVQETFDYNLSSKVDYSAIEYNQYNEISGIGGSSIAGGINSAVVSSIASSYAESAASSKQDISGMSAWIPWSSSGVFQPSGSYQTAGDYAFNSSLSSKVEQSAFDDCCSAVHSALDDKFDKSASGMLQPSGDYAYNSSLSSYIPTSASGMFQPSGQYQTAGDYAFNSSLSAKLDASASSSFVLNSAFSSWSSDVDSSLSSFSSSITSINSSITDIENSITSMSSDMSAYVPFSGLEGDGMKITGISGSAIKGHEYTGINPVLVDNVNDTISVDHRTLCVDSTMTAYNSGSSAVIGVNQNVLDLKADASALSSYQPTSAMSAYATELWASGEISAKLDVTASSLFITALPADLATTADVASAVSGKMDKVDGSAFYPMTGNPSGFLTAHQSLAGLATETYVDSAVSGKLDSTAYNSAQFYLSSNPSGFVDSAYVESQVSGKQDSGNYISAKGLTQTITNAAGTSAIAFGTYGAGAQSSTEKPGIFITGEFGTAYYKDNELNLNRADMKIAFNIGGQGPKISSMATGTHHSYMYLFASGRNSGTYSETGVVFKDSGNNTVALYDSSTYGNITSVYDTVSANSATWGQGGVDSATVSSIASSYAESAVSSKLDATAQVVTATGSGTWDYEDCISSVNGSPLYAKYAGLAYYDSDLRRINELPDTDAVSAIASAYAESAASGKLDATAFNSGDFYTTSNESGFVGSAYVDGQVSSKQDASAMTAYQAVSGMTAYQPSGDYAFNSSLSSYQPSGDYIYVSALGWAEV